MGKAAATLRYIESLIVTQGEGAGQPFRLLPWEKKFVRGVLRDGVHEAGLTIARGNGKSTLCAALGAAALDGPLAQPRGDVIAVAASLDQARIILDHAKRFVLPDWPDYDKSRWRVRDFPGPVIEDKTTGTRLRGIASNADTNLGAAPFLVLADEPAAWGTAKQDDGRRMYAILRTALGKVAGARFVALGTRPASGDHWFARLLRDADYAQVHAADKDDPPHSARTWARANPSLRYMPALRAAIESESRRAQRDSELLPEFLAYRINAGVADHAESLLLTADVWLRCESEAAARGPFTLGVDLGATQAMSGFAAYWPQTGKLDAFAVFPANPSLEQRGDADGVGSLYTKMHTRGELMIAGEFTSNVQAALGIALQRWGRPAVIVADRWREGDLREALVGADFPQAALATRGMGFRDGAEDCRLFRVGCADGDVHAATSLLLRSALSEARVVGDPAGNFKLSKGTQGGRRFKARDDAAAAAILAVAEGVRRKPSLLQPRRGPRYAIVR